MATAARSSAPVIEERIVGPQPGPQTQFMACRADIGIYGGGVYGGKTWALTFLPLKHIETPGFSCVTFRRTTPDIRNPGSLWDESVKWYPDAGGDPHEFPLEWEWPNGVVIKMAGLQHETDALRWKSSQIALLQFDQLEEFGEYQFWYMQSRNRTGCGVRAYCRAGCNPLADTWLAELLQWWWDPDTGYAIERRSGIARWFLRVRDVLTWSTVACPCDADERTWLAAEARAVAELEAIHPGNGQFARSLAFIRAHLADNVIGVAQDPGYEARVRSLSLVEQERLLGGNWKIRAAAGLVFDRAWFDIVDAVPVPAIVVARGRAWDKAGTSGGGDYTAGVKGSLGRDGVIYVEDAEVGQWGAGDRERVIRQKAQDDVRQDPNCIFGVEQEPGSGGKDSAVLTVTTTLAGYNCRVIVHNASTGDLVERAQPLAAQAQVRNVKLVRGPWNERFLRELHAFPTPGVPDDQVSAAEMMYKLIQNAPAGAYRPARIRA
jgi:predicted phage terminase large subunit-like protein